MKSLAMAGVLFTGACGYLPGGTGGDGAAKRQPFTVAFGGDIHFEGALRAKLDSDPDGALRTAGPGLRAADLAVVNLETAVTTGGDPAPKQFTFRAPPTAFRALRGAGVDVATMANNHGMDYGESGLRDSLAAAKQAGLPVVGIGGSAAEAYRPWTTTVKGNKVAIIGATQVLDDNLIQTWTATDTKAGLASAKNAARLVRAVQEADKTADIVIVDLHWGQELNNCPIEPQKQLARQLAGAGADAIIGSHAHVLLAGGYLSSSYVHYGLGNFVFYSSGGRTAQSGILTLTFGTQGDTTGVSKADWAPAVLDEGVARPLSGTAAQQARASWEGLRRCAGLAAAPTR